MKRNANNKADLDFIKLSWLGDLIIYNDSHCSISKNGVRVDYWPTTNKISINNAKSIKGGVRTIERLLGVKIKTPKNTPMKFKAPKVLPEANTQAEIYRILRNKGIKCCLEYGMKCEYQNRNIRADIAVIKDGYIICLVECKSKGSSPDEEGRQYDAYDSLGVEFIYCMGWKEIKKTVEYIIELHKTGDK